MVLIKFGHLEIQIHLNVNKNRYDTQNTKRISWYQSKDQIQKPMK